MQKNIKATAKVRASYAPCSLQPTRLCSCSPSAAPCAVFLPASVCVWVCGWVCVRMCASVCSIVCIVLLIPQNLEPIGARNPHPPLSVSRCIPPPSFVLLFKTQESSKHEITISLSPKIILQSSWTMKCCLTKPNVTICLWTRTCKCLWNVATGLSRTRHPSWGGCASARGQTATGSGAG